MLFTLILIPSPSTTVTGPLLIAVKESALGNAGETLITLIATLYVSEPLCPSQEPPPCIVAIFVLLSMPAVVLMLPVLEFITNAGACPFTFAGGTIALVSPAQLVVVVRCRVRGLNIELCLNISGLPV